MKNNTKLVLSEEFERLKSNFQQPKLYLTSYFSAIRDEIDIAFAQKRINETDEILKDELNKNWIEMIRRVDSFEKECLKNLKSCRNDNWIDFKSIKIKLNSLESADQIKEVVKQEMFQIEKTLFINKTMIFLNRKWCADLNLTSEQTMRTNVGKLLFIKDEYLSLNCIQLMANNDLINQKNLILNNKILKLKELKNKLNPFIDEIELTMHNLQVLYLNEKNIKELKADTLNDLTKLQELHLSGNFLQSIDANTFTLTINLRKLDLSKNKLNTIHSKLFSRLVYLEELNLSCNTLKELDSSTFNYLSHLKVLDLSRNNLADLKQNLFDGLISLQELHLQHNDLTSVIIQLSELKNLKELYLSGNRIEFINSSAFKGLIGLEKIDLNSNRIFAFEQDTFNDLNSLNELNISDNLIDSVDPALFLNCSKNFSLIIKNRANFE